MEEAAGEPWGWAAEPGGACGEGGKRGSRCGERVPARWLRGAAPSAGVRSTAPVAPFPRWSWGDEVVLCLAASSCALLRGLVSPAEGGEACSTGLECES